MAPSTSRSAWSNSARLPAVTLACRARKTMSWAKLSEVPTRVSADCPCPLSAMLSDRATLAAMSAWMRIASAIDELGCDADEVGGPTNAARQQIGSFEARSRDHAVKLGDRGRGRAADHLQPDARQSRPQLLADPLGEIVLLGIVRHVGEGQNGNALGTGRAGPECEPPAACRCDSTDQDGAGNKRSARDARTLRRREQALMLFATDPGTHREEKVLETRVVDIAIPPLQRKRLDLAKAQWRVDRIDQDGQIGAEAHGPGCLVANEMAFRSHRAPRPGDDDASSIIEMSFDLFPPASAAAYSRVPPDVQVLRLKGGNQRLQPRTILGLIGNEDVASRLRHADPRLQQRQYESLRRRLQRKLSGSPWRYSNPSANRWRGSPQLPYGRERVESRHKPQGRFICPTSRLLWLMSPSLGFGLTNHARPNPPQKPRGTINFINFPSAKVDNHRRNVGSSLQEWRSLH